MKPLKIPKIGSLVRGHFLSGVLVVAPFAVVLWIALKLLSALWALRMIVPPGLRPENYLGNQMFVALLDLVMVGLSTLGMVLGISLVGWLSKQFIGKKLLEWVAEVIQRIPLLRTIYGALDQLLKALSSTGGEQFRRVVIVEYPRQGSYSLAFVTGEAGFKTPDGSRMLNIFIPTTPNPTSGFHLMVPETQVKDTGMSVEEGFRMLLSLGMVKTKT